MAGTPRDWLERILAPLAENGVSVKEIMEQPVPCPTAPQVPFSDHLFPTASGKFEFLTDYDFSSREVPGYPLTLVTNFSKLWLLSQMTSTEHPVPFVRIGPQVAEEHGIEDNETIVVKSTVGQLKIKARVDARIGAEMVVMPVGTWIKRGGGANILTEDILTNHGLMAAYGETRVAIEKLVDHASPT
jgi:anaerobic selenocysteine-containing dehydrogenase